MDPSARRELTARLHAWWEGAEYVPPEPSDEVADAAGVAPESAPSAPALTTGSAAAPKTRRESRPAETADASPPESDGAVLRVRALETIWGVGRFGPGSPELDTLLLDELFASADHGGDIGFLGADAALLMACRERSGRQLHASDWREACRGRVHELVEGISVSTGEPDRPKNLPSGGLAALLSIDAFAFADHKASLVTRVYKSLTDTGRWVALDTTRASRKTPLEAFASAWAEPQLATAAEIDELLQLAGFRNIRREPARDIVLAAARAGYQRLGASLDAAVKSGTCGRAGSLFLQELAWETASWRARARALEGGALEAHIWIIDRGAGGGASARRPVTQPVPAEADPFVDADDGGWAAAAAEAEAGAGADAGEAAGPLDQNSIDSLFD